MSGSFPFFFCSHSECLLQAYPTVEWDESKFASNFGGKSQELLRKYVTTLLPPETVILYNYLHPTLKGIVFCRCYGCRHCCCVIVDKANLIMTYAGSVGRHFELDVYVPSLSLAFEYQGLCKTVWELPYFVVFLLNSLHFFYCFFFKIKENITTMHTTCMVIVTSLETPMSERKKFAKNSVCVIIKNKTKRNQTKRNAAEQNEEFRELIANLFSFIQVCH